MADFCQNQIIACKFSNKNTFFFFLPSLAFWCCSMLCNEILFLNHCKNVCKATILYLVSTWGERITYILKPSLFFSFWCLMFKIIRLDTTTLVITNPNLKDDHLDDTQYACSNLLKITDKMKTKSSWRGKKNSPHPDTLNSIRLSWTPVETNKHTSKQTSFGGIQL